MVPRLAHGTSGERANLRLIGGGAGIHWPDLDEDISVESLLAGRRLLTISSAKTQLTDGHGHRPPGRPPAPSPPAPGTSTACSNVSALCGTFGGITSDSPARTVIRSDGVMNSIAPCSIVVIRSFTWLCVGTVQPFRRRIRATVIVAP